MDLALIDASEMIQAQMTLGNFDFPDDYIEIHHPDDYTSLLQPLTPDFIFYQGRGPHWRLLLRISFKIDEKFIPMTFVLDTGAPMGLYVSELTRRALVSRIMVDEEMGTETIYLNSLPRRISVQENSGSQANIIGMRLLSQLGLQLFENEYTLTLCPDFF